MPQGERTVEERAEPETAAPEPLAAPQPAPPARVLALQRQAGNQAVAAMLSPSPPRIARLQTREDLDRQYHSHLNERPPNWDDAARDLNGFNDADIRERVRDLDPDQLDPIKAASERVNGASAHRIRTPILERQWRTAVQRRNWRTAATYLNGFNHEDIDRLLGAMDPDDLMHLDDEVLKTDYPLISAQAAPIRTAGEPRRLADLDRRYRDAVGRKDWRQAAELLNTYNDADIERLAGEFTDTEELQQFGRVALVSFQLRVLAGIGAVLSRPPHAERVRLQILEADWADARRAGDFTKMAILSRQFSPPEMENHLLTLHLPELEGLVEQTRGLGALLFPALVEPAERHRARKHLEMTRFAIDNSQWWYAVTLLNGLSPADIITWVDGLTAPQFSAIQPLVYIRYTDSNPLFRRVNYRMNLPALAGAHPTTSSGVTPNAGDPSVAVPGGGTVTTHANDAGGAGWFGQDYQGPNAQQVGWIQFLAREAEKFDARGRSLGFDDEMVTYAAGQSEPRRWGTATRPYWTVDTMGGALPFYDSPTTAAVGGTPAGTAGASDVSAGQQAMWDMPGARPDVARHAFDTWFWETDVATVTVRMRFVQYMVRGPDVVMRGSMVVSWTYSGEASAGAGVADPPRTNTPGPTAAYDHLDSAHHAALVRRFPLFRYLPHD
jgi:hypothetical protein